MKKQIIASVSAILALTSATYGQSGSDNLAAVSELAEVPITVDNFVRAATDVEFKKYISLAGGVNRFFHFREPTPVENQPTIAMNRDTLYSAIIVDISEGALLTLPDVGDRYLSTMVVNQDHYINEVFQGGGSYVLNMETFDTPFVGVFMRTLVDASDPQDVAEVNAFQDAMSVEAKSSKPFIPPNYDEDAIQDFISTLIPISPFAPDASRTFGSKEEVDGFRHVLGTAGGWGGLPETEAFYENVNPQLPVGEYKIEVPADVPVEAFWSVSIYNAASFFEPNERNAYNINSVSGARNNDGSMTVHLGGCDDDRINCLPLMDGWNYALRLYKPQQAVLDKTWTPPTPQPVV